MSHSRIALFGRYPFYRSILEPVRAAIGPDIETLLTGDAKQVVAFRPHVLLVAAHDRLEYFRHRLPETHIGNIRHGLVSKAVLARTPRRPAARHYDFVCAGPDDTVADVYDRVGAAPGEIWRTGYPQLDPLHRRDPAPDLGLDPARPTVLYAPTWNLGLSSAPMLGSRAVDLIRQGAPGANVIIKPHPVVGDWHPDWMRWWRDAARSQPNVLLVEDTHADVTPFMLAADLLVSDASSVIFLFLALDRPMVLVTNPLARADPAFDPDDIIWRWRDVGAEVRAIADVPDAIRGELAAPQRRAAERARYGAILFAGQADGRNAERIAARASARSREVAARGARERVREGLLARLPLSDWALHDLARSIWQRPAIRRRVAGPLERRRLARRALALRAGTLRGPDGVTIVPASGELDASS